MTIHDLDSYTPQLLINTRPVSAVVDEVNRNLLTYQRISKVTILPEPLEMTTTKKVKRIYKK